MTTFNGRLNVKNGDLTVLDNANRPRIQLTTTGTVNVKDSLGVANAVSLSNNGIDMLNRKIVNVGNPTNDLDGVNKRYVDNNLSDLAASVGVGLRVREPVRLRTTDAQASSILASGHTFTGTGATKFIIKTAPFVALSIDGTLAAVNDRILFDGTGSSHHYGIYNVNIVGSGAAAYELQRIDIDLNVNNYVLVNEGATLANSSYILTEYGGTIDSSTLGLQTWTKFSNAGGGGGGTGVVETVTIGSVTGIPTGDGFWINGTAADPVINLDLTKATAIGTDISVGTLNTGNVRIIDATESTMITDGALVVDGGVGIAKNLVIGGEIRSYGAGADVDLVLDPKGNGNVVINGMLASGGAGADVDLVLDPKGIGKVVVPDIVVSGSIIGSTNLDSKELIIQATTTPLNNGKVRIATITESTTTDTGALVVDGGVGIAKNLNVGGSTNIAIAEASDEIINILTGANVDAAASVNIATGDNFNGRVNIATGASIASPNGTENQVNIGTGSNSYTRINMGGGTNSFSSISINTNPNSGITIIGRLVEPTNVLDASNKTYNDKTNLLKKPAKYRTTNTQANIFMDEAETVYVTETTGDLNTYIEGLNNESIQDFLFRMTGSPTIDGQIPSQEDIFLLINTSGTSYKQGLYKITVIGDAFVPWRITRTDSVNIAFYRLTDSLYGLTVHCLYGAEFANTTYIVSNVDASLYPSGTIQFTQISLNIEYINIVNTFPLDLDLQRQTYINNYFQSGIELNIANPATNIIKKITLSGDSKSVVIKTSTDRFFLTAEEPYLELSFTVGATKWKKVSTSSYPTTNDSNIVVNISNSPEITSGRSSIAISKDKTTLAVGYRDYNGGEGAVFVYTMIDNIWRQQTGAIVGTGFINVGNQGASVALSADGNTLAVGGPTHDNDIGAVWIFTRTGTTWTQQSLLGDPGLTGQRQGTSVALSGNGDVLAIGGPKNSGGDIGITLIYRRSVGVWTLDTTITGASGTNDSSQGTSVALSDNGDTLAIGGPTDDGGQGRVWVYFYNGAAWVSQATLFDPLSSGTNPPRQGTSVALSNSGDVLAVGAPRDGGTNPSNSVGSTRVYRRSAGIWNITPVILIGTGVVGPQHQGTTVSISGDGNVLAIGAPTNVTGATYIFTYNVTWAQQTRLVDEFTGTNGIDQGRTLALSSNGDMVVMQGINGLGTVFNLVFSRGGNSWRQRGKSFVTSNSIGYTKIGSISISSNGIYLAVGLPEINNLNGGVLIYIKSNTGWDLQTPTPLVGSDIIGPVASRQGTSVALSADGSTLAIGGPGDNDTRGAVWIFNRTGTNWVEEAAKIAPPGTAINNTTCAYISLSYSGDTLAIGSEDTNLSWIYTRTTGVWTLRTPVGLLGDGLSNIVVSRSTVSLSGDGSILAVGYPGDNNGRGAVVIFTRIGNEWGQYDAKLVSLSVDGDALFGSSVSLSGDGTTLAVGAPNDKVGLGSVVVYVLENTFWVQKNKKYYYYENYAVGNGVSVKLNNTGNIMVVGANNYQEGQGAALVYAADKEKIFTLKKPLIGKTTDSVGVGQGKYVDISGDASVVVSAAPNELFFENRNLWTFV